MLGGGSVHTINQVECGKYLDKIFGLLRGRFGEGEPLAIHADLLSKEDKEAREILSCLSDSKFAFELLINERAFRGCLEIAISKGRLGDFDKLLASLEKDARVIVGDKLPPRPVLSQLAR
jgi:hypothetical protein